MIISYKIKRKNFIKNCDIGSGFYYQKKDSRLGWCLCIKYAGEARYCKSRSRCSRKAIENYKEAWGWGIMCLWNLLLQIVG